MKDIESIARSLKGINKPHVRHHYVFSTGSSLLCWTQNKQ